jgi:hypothetical protein
MERVKRVKRKLDDAGFLDRRLSPQMAARLLNVDPSRISQLRRDGTIEAVGGQFAAGKLVHDFIRYVEQRKTSARIDDDKKIRALRIEAMERKAKQDAGEWVPIDWMKETELTLCGKLLSHIVSVPARFTRDIKERRRLEAMLDEGRAEFCNSIGRLKGPKRKASP